MSPRAWLLLVACSALWGLPYLLIKILVEDGVPVSAVAFARCAIGAAVLLPVAWLTGALDGMAARWRALTVLALLDMAVPFVLITAGERHIASSFAGILIATVPLLVAILALRWDPSERVNGSRLAGLLVGLGGVALLLGVEVSGDEAATLGSALVLLASALYAAATLYLKRAFAGVSSLGVVTGTLLAASVVLAPAAAVQSSSLPAVDSEWVTALVALGVLCSALAYLAYYALVALVGAGRAAINTYLSPAIAVAAGVAFLGESVGLAAVGGMGLILAGAWLSSGGRSPSGALEPVSAPISARPGEWVPPGGP